ncbi:MAG: ATP-grasp domain-containing protein [Thauera sp.]|nr:ATP-grasp domain-containing protein [Thauera sp.]
MPAPERVLVFEFISAHGLGADESAGQLSTAANPTSTGEGESLLQQGMAMRDAIVADLIAAGGYEIGVTTSDAAPFAASDPTAPCTTLTVLAGESPAAFLTRLAPLFDHVWVVAPETDGILAHLCRVVGPRRWVGCSEDAIVICSSKRATRDALAAHGIAVPAAWQAGEAAPQTDGAWIVKPDAGAGTQDTRRHARFADARADFDARRRAGRSATLERWVEGEPLSLSLLCRSDRTELLSINRQRIELAVDGTLSYHGVDTDIEPTGSHRGGQLAELARRIRAAMPGLAGFVGVDLAWTPEGRPVVIEINPRPTCAYVGLSRRLGRNLAADILAGREPRPASSPIVRASEEAVTEQTA